uniref:Uncharacterized protein n=1 Tax=Tanacetum cinerariifolium TaxID=118510 RepID=A0A6L2L7T0_TANCI|nr:hypothetical protein [Tanacetum cinerariifolium]
MIVHAQEEIGKGSINSTDPHHTSTIIQPLTSQPQKKQKPRKTNRKDTELPQTSSPTTSIADEAVNEEIDDILVRAATTASSLEAEQDSDEGLGEEDASKHGRIADINANKDIYLVNVHIKEDMFGVNDLDGDEMIVESVDVVKTAKKIVSAASIILVSAVTTTTVITDVSITLAQALAELESAKPKDDKVLIQEPEQGITTTTLTTTTDATTITAASTRPKAKGLVIHEQEQAPTPIVSSNNHHRVNTFVDYKIELVMERSKKAEAKVIEGSLKRVGEEHEQKNVKKQKMKDDKETVKLKQHLEIILDDGDEVYIDATTLSSKSSTIVNYKIHKEGKKSYFYIFKADGSSQMYLTLSKILKIDREDLEVLWRLVKVIFEKIKLVDYMDNLLLHNLKTMFEHHVEDNVWKNQQGLVKVLNWKLYDSCRVHCITL